MSDFINKLNKVSKAVERLPPRLAITAERFSKERFVQKNWVDRSRVSWKPNKVKKTTGSLMIGSGSGYLKRSVRKISWNRNRIVIGTNVPYARIHNEGGVIKKNVRVREHRRARKGRKHIVKEHTRKMNTVIPQRQFIGESAVLMRRLERQIERDLKNAIK